MAEDDDSYSAECEANMQECLHNLIENLKTVGSADAYKNALFGIKLIVDKKQRRLSDLSSIGPGPQPRSLELMVFSRELIPQIVKEIKAAGFRNVQSNEVLQKVIVIVPKPTLEELQQVADEVARITRSTIANVAKIKSNTQMRLKSALENEYIDPPTAGKATKKLWYYQLDAGRSLGKTNSLNENDLADFIKLSKKQELSDNSWSISLEKINKDSWNLEVKNPNTIEKIDNRTAKEILTEIEELNLKSVKATQAIKNLLE